jgi:hypothetical protein
LSSRARPPAAGEGREEGEDWIGSDGGRRGREGGRRQTSGLVGRREAGRIFSGPVSWAYTLEWAMLSAAFRLIHVRTSLSIKTSATELIKREQASTSSNF